MGTEYPEWVHHVAFGYEDGRQQKTWCGAPDPRPFFQNPTHAALNGLHGGRLVACPECVKAIHEALCNGHGDINAGEEDGK